ncbi:uncharacterized protein [Macrobrachium rosenbergii]|uniref:uncharacterized protein n=1 Tax=Macrobrachium rosenbergii TaxID=79674 RepID=UPI0034D4473A
MLLVLKFISIITGYQFPLDPLLYLIRLAQQQHYPGLVAYLFNSNLKVSADIKNFAFQLNLSVDQQNLVRTKGRIQYANLKETAKSPYLLPPQSHLTTLIIRYFHVLNHHCGVSVLLVLLREQFWIPKCRQVVKSIINKCVFCKKVAGKVMANPGPPPLPAERVTLTRPFSCVGIDYTGAICYAEPDSDIQGKAYVCLFTCASVRAVHLELVSSVSASDFLLAFRRFCALYSVPDVIITDNARNFVGFQHFWKEISDEPEVMEHMQNLSVKWKFSVPRAPWKNGFLNV